MPISPPSLSSPVRFTDFALVLLDNAAYHEAVEEKFFAMINKELLKINQFHQGECVRACVRVCVCV